MAVSKRTRFEVFKRDLFTCQYCGRTPPTVVLECDHVIAVSNGGTDKTHNLVTSCFDCNRGKSDIPLGVVIPSVANRLEREKEIATQIDSFNRFLAKRKRLADEDVREIGIAYYNHICDAQNKFVFGQGRVPSIRTFLKRLPKTRVLEAVDIAHAKKPIDTIDPRYEEPTWKYFCGICWKMIRDMEGDDE